MKSLDKTLELAIEGAAHRHWAELVPRIGLVESLVREFGVRRETAEALQAQLAEVIRSSYRSGARAGYALATGKESP